jgi:hypothetical protein
MDVSEARAGLIACHQHHTLSYLPHREKNVWVYRAIPLSTGATIAKIPALPAIRVSL